MLRDISHIDNNDEDDDPMFLENVRYENELVPIAFKGSIENSPNTDEINRDITNDNLSGLRSDERNIV